MPSTKETAIAASRTEPVAKETLWSFTNANPMDAIANDRNTGAVVCMYLRVRTSSTGLSGVPFTVMLRPAQNEQQNQATFQTICATLTTMMIERYGTDLLPRLL